MSFFGMDFGYAELIPVFLLVIGIIYFATKDSSNRGLGKYQIFFLRIVIFFTFPIGFILYFFLRPKYQTVASSN
jgi:uncharacterized membrane protein